MLEEQHGSCLICENPINTSTAHIDHCHTDGHVRGLLCSNCNTCIGLAKENIGTLQKAIEYLEFRK